MVAVLAWGVGWGVVLVVQVVEVVVVVQAQPHGVLVGWDMGSTAVSAPPVDLPCCRLV